VKKILILVSRYGINLKLADFLKEDLKSKSRVFYHTFSDVSVAIHGGRVDVSVAGTSLLDFDLVYFRKVGKKYLPLAGAIALCLERESIPYIDSVFGNIGPIGNKLYSLTRLCISGLPVIPTLYYPMDSVKKNIKKIERQLGYPFIAKDVSLQGLKGVYSIKNRSEMDKLLSKDSTNYIFQKFVNIKKEYRLLVLGGEVKVVHTKVPRTYENFKVDYLSRNSKEKFLNVKNLSGELTEIAVKSARALELEIAGVDLAVLTDNKPVLIEANRGPAFSSDLTVSPEYREVSRFLSLMFLSKNME